MFSTPLCIWFTGLSGAGKSTLADALAARLQSRNGSVFVLDGDKLRCGLNSDLGFTAADRTENIRRVAHVSRLMVDAGLTVLVSVISPSRADRVAARALFAKGEFVEVFVDTSLAECERRDVKGLYAKARRGELKNFTGIDSPYEPPQQPEIHLRTERQTLNACTETLLGHLGAAPWQVGADTGANTGGQCVGFTAPRSASPGF